MPAAMRRIGPESLDESSRADLAMAFALGFRSPATLLDWLGVIGIIAAAAFAAAWLTVALGMAAKTPQSAGLAVVPLILLPFLNSAIVPAATMGQGARQFAQYQPFTPIIESFLLGRTRPRNTIPQAATELDDRRAEHSALGVTRASRHRCDPLSPLLAGERAPA